MKFLFITTGSQATFYAIAPLATAARNAGHEVILAAHEPWLETAEAIGVPTVCYTSEPIRQFMKTSRAGTGLIFPKELGDEEMLSQGRGFARMACAGLKALLDLAEDWSPDLVIGSSMSYSAGLLATRLKVPYVRHVEYLGIPTTGIDPGAKEELRPELERLGLAGLRAWTFSVEEAARAALMSPGHFSRSFRAAFGETPYSYLMTRRVERAKALLRRGDLTVTEVCFVVGCTSLGSFSSRFTELVGESPNSYRAAAMTRAPPSRPASPRSTRDRSGIEKRDLPPARSVTRIEINHYSGKNG